MSLFGVHIPELQLDTGDFREALAAAQLQPGETYLELGCGHGRGLVVAAQEFQARAVGVDYLPDALAEARQRARRAGVGIELVQGDLMQHDPTDADVVLLHLGPAFHDVLAPRLERLLTPHTRVVACGWQVPGWHDMWDSYGFDAGYVYRPGDPRQHGEWTIPGVPARTTPGQPLPHVEHRLADVGRIDVLTFAAGADLHDIELRLGGPLAAMLSARAGSTRLGRGQSTLVELRWPARHEVDPLDGGERRASLELWARSASGRFTLRGASVSLSAV